MTCKTIPDVADRFLFLRNNPFYYRRRIPKEIAAFDKRSHILCESLGTSNVFEARANRDLLESGDNEYWSSLLLGQKHDKDGIHLDAPVPYIEIAPRLEEGNRREIKTSSSIRKIPLIGLSVIALAKFPDGFPRYQDKENSLSATLNKFFQKNRLFASKGQTIYSFRHSFEDRMKEAGLDYELRRRLMGHSIDRPQYGTGGSLEWQQGELKKIELPFDPDIILTC